METIMVEINLIVLRLQLNDFGSKKLTKMSKKEKLVPFWSFWRWLYQRWSSVRSLQVVGAVAWWSNAPGYQGTGVLWDNAEKLKGGPSG